MFDNLIYQLIAMIQSIFIGWGRVFYTAFIWTDIVANHQISKWFWASIVEEDFYGKGWFYVYRWGA